MLSVFLPAMVVKAEHACSGVAHGHLHFTHRYSNNVSMVLNLELTPARYGLPTSALERLYLLAVSTAREIRDYRSRTIEAVARHYTFIARDKLRKNLLSNAKTHGVRKRKNESTIPRSPRSCVAISGPNCSSTQLTQNTLGYGLSPELIATQERGAHPSHMTG